MNENYEKNNFIERESGTAFSIGAISPYFVMFIASVICSFIYKDYLNTNWYTYVSYLATQIANFIIVVYFCVKKKGEPLKLLKIKKFNPKYLLLMLMLSVGLLFGLGYLNDLFVDFLIKLGLGYNGLQVPINNVSELIASVIVIALFPAVFEELIFRGIILQGTNKFRIYQAILINGLFFAIFHQNPAQTIYQFITGCVFALIVIRSGSVLSSIIMHFANNAVIILILYFFPNTNFYVWWVIVISIVLFILAIIYLVFFDKNDSYSIKTEKPDKKQFYITSAIGIVFCVVMWIVTLFV